MVQLAPDDLAPDHEGVHGPFGLTARLERLDVRRGLVASQQVARLRLKGARGRVEVSALARMLAGGWWLVLLALLSKPTRGVDD